MRFKQLERQRMHLAFREAAGAEGAEPALAPVFKSDSAKMLRAELPVHKKRTL